MQCGRVLRMEGAALNMNTQSKFKHIVFATVAILLLPSTSVAQTVEYIHTDALGTPIAVTDSSGQIVERGEYEPYGQPLGTTPVDAPGFTGHVQDGATGLTYMQQRYYDPQVGRFLSVDPVTADSANGQNFNRYWYANNNPYKFTDPDGRQAAEARAEELNDAASNYAAGQLLAMLPKSAFVELGGSAQGGVVVAGGAAQASAGLIRPLFPAAPPSLANVYLSGGGFMGGVLGSASVPKSETPNFVAGASAGLDA
jgi:RHS repeat-associated protein